MGMKQLSNYEPYNGYYQFIGATKYRKELFKKEKIRESLENIITNVISKKIGVELIECTVAYNHIHVLIKTELAPADVGQVLYGATSRLIRREYPILVDEVKVGLWGGKSWEAIKDKGHFDNCVSYIQRHQPDNTKLD